MRQLRLFPLLALLVAVAVGCDDNSPTAPVIEEQEPVPTVTDTFSGTFGMAETGCHTFTSVNPGPAELTITALAPLETLTVGLGIGRDDGDPATACNYFAVDNSVRVNQTLLSQLTTVDTYCVCIFDVGNVFPDQTVTYTFTVEHP